jgi:hypothetical protein
MIPLMITDFHGIFATLSITINLITQYTPKLAAASGMINQQAVSKVISSFLSCSPH